MTSPTTWATWSAARSRWYTATGRKVPRAGAVHPEPAGHAPAGRALAELRHQTPQRVATALAAFDFRAATAAIWAVVEEANRYVERAQPWRLARAERDGDPASGEQLDESLALLIETCSQLGRDLAPFLPGLAARIQAACDDSAGQLPPARPVFPRLELAQTA